MHPNADAIESVLTVEGTEDKATGTARFCSDLPVLTGHFPGNPLIPGVHVLALVAEVARRTGIAYGMVQAVEKAKWSAPVYPNEDLQIAVTCRPVDGGYRLDGEVKKGDVVCATCRLILG